MKLIKVYKKLLNEGGILSELIVKGRRRDDRQNIISYKEYLFLLDDDEIPPEAARALDDVVDVAGGDDFHDIVGIIEDSGLPIIMGSIENNTLFVYRRGGFYRDPKSSIQIKKIVNQLNLSGVEYYSGDEDDRYFSGREEIKGKIPDIAYHGTCSEYIEKIMRAGLAPGKSPSNYPNIEKSVAGFKDLMKKNVYFSTRFDEAKMHAEHTAAKVGGDPVIISFLIPDKNKLQVDFDVERDFKSKRKFGQSKDVGVYGYSGRIPKSFFRGFWVYPTHGEGFSGMEGTVSADEYVELDDADMDNYLESIDAYGYGVVGYDPADFMDDDE